MSRNDLNFGVIKFINSEAFINVRNTFISICQAQQSLLNPDNEGEEFAFQLLKSNRAVIFRPETLDC